MNKRIKFITETAVCIAVLIVVQLSTRGMTQLVTGSLVNAVLIVTALTAGLAGGICTAVISPFLAFLLGIGPKFLTIVPVVAAGNLIIVLTVYAIINQFNMNYYIKWLLAVILGAVLKFAALYFGIVKLVLPLLSLPPQKAAAISASFGAVQAVTAVIGGIVACSIVTTLKKHGNKKYKSM